MGARLRVNYEGRLNLAVDVDLQKLVGIDKLTLHANMFQIHGDGLSRSNLQNFFVVSGIEPLPSTRLYEAYFEKQWGAKKVSLKFGQIAADSEFFNTKYTDVFTNASMGWPAITSLDRGIGVFTRVAGAPADRNLIDLYADAGIEFIGLRDYRPDDKFGIAAGYAHVSKRAQALDADYRTLVHPNWPVRSFEGLLTAVYQYQVKDGWTVQPNFQYIVHPGGGATLPAGPLAGKALRNASVFGLRTTLKF